MCPARPTRCRPLAIPCGDCTCSTASTEPISMPSSSELVAISAGRRPDLSACSSPSRISRETLPWCARKGPPTRPVPIHPCPLGTPSTSSPSTDPGAISSSDSRAYCSLSRSARRSAARRLLVKTSVVSWRLISSSTQGTNEGQTEPPGRRLRSGTGVMTCRSIGLAAPASTTVTGLGMSTRSPASSTCQVCPPM